MTKAGSGGAGQEETVVGRRKAKCLIGVVLPESVIMAKPTWPQFLIYKIKGCEKMASGDKSMGKFSVWRQEGPIVWPGLHPLTQLVL